MRPFLFGFQPSIDTAPFLPTESAYHQVGDNTGNLAFCYAIDRLLGEGLASTLWHTNPERLKTFGDVGVLTLANQLGPHANLGYLNNSFRKIKDVSLVGIGLGAQAAPNQDRVEVPEGTLEWVRVIQERSPTSAPNIAVRGDFSMRVLEHYGLAEKAVATGCPTLFISPDRSLGQTIYQRFSPKMGRIAVTAGHQRWTHLAQLEASLVALSQCGGGAYICQSPLEMVQIGRGEVHLLDPQSRDQCRAYTAPWMSNEEFINWSQRYACSFFSAAAWLEYLRRFDFVVGTRIHGVMLALQVGIPALCIVHDSRTTELCETMAVPYVKAQDHRLGITRDQLPSLFKFDPDAFDKNRVKRARIFADFLRSNELVAAPYLSGLAG
ncbi:polysaccharide pyruvyl transferase family protein [Cupriavidus oxalaticus]|uniref:Polysaccharide pyruvyl transferase family protein n=1 Tax=Cupriavidus oxalaticus TaxID=96344 RepID=A0A4P7L7Q1_9BURK|nr:polysaccharide pyruvyl transferase family protein [Cupriavidus oxalaticus]QBY49679.1 polysaccharide pyruvyl transferase family protein [Cupriavidus oxalaticus]